MMQGRIRIFKVAQTGKQFEDRDSHVEDIAEGSDIDLDAVVSSLVVNLFIRSPI